MSALTTPEFKDFKYGIAKVKTISFFVNEVAYINDPKKEVRVQMSHVFGTSPEFGLVDFRLSTFFLYPERPDQILSEIVVQNVFSIQNFSKYHKGNFTTFPSEFILSMISMSISHSRALYINQLSGTLFQDFMLPITNSLDAAKHFFPTLFNKKTGVLNPTITLERFGAKM
jgi:hypothetical protein